MTDELIFYKPMIRLGMFWWAFTARGGAAVLFSAFLFYAGGFFGTIFFDPIMLVVLAMMLGFYILGNGVLLGVASGYAAEHDVGICNFFSLNVSSPLLSEPTLAFRCCSLPSRCRG